MDMRSCNRWNIQLQTESEAKLERSEGGKGGAEEWCAVTGWRGGDVPLIHNGKPHAKSINIRFSQTAASKFMACSFFPSVISVCVSSWQAVSSAETFCSCETLKQGPFWCQFWGFLKETWHKSKHYRLILSELVGWCSKLTCLSWQQNVYCWIKTRISKLMAFNGGLRE